MEKSWQVQQMWTIFREAKFVAAWLGLAADDSNLVLAQIADVPEMQARDVGGYPSLERPQRFVNWRGLLPTSCRYLPFLHWSNAPIGVVCGFSKSYKPQKMCGFTVEGKGFI